MTQTTSADLALIVHAIERTILSHGGNEKWLQGARVALPPAIHDRVKAGLRPGTIDLRQPSRNTDPAGSFRFNGLLFTASG
jgi:hypothetical protein